MTAPAPVLEYPAGYEPPPDQEDNPAVAAVLAALVAYFASQAAISAGLMPIALVQRLVGIGIAPRAARAAGRLALSVPMTGRSRYGAPTAPTAGASMARRAAAEEPAMRARYVLNAARRLTGGLVAGSFLDDLRAEQRYLGQHLAAGRNRAQAARSLDEAAAKSASGWLRWRTHPEKGDVTAACDALNGKLFTRDNLPVAAEEGQVPRPVYPGAMHPKCKCTAEAA